MKIKLTSSYDTIQEKIEQENIDFSVIVPMSLMGCNIIFKCGQDSLMF